MKKLLIVIGIMVIALPLYAQWNPMIATSPVIDVRVLGDTTVTVYILFPDNNGTWYISETAPDKYYFESGGLWRKHRIKGYVTLGHNYLCVESNKTTGTPDSLAFTINPYVYDAKDDEFSAVGNDVTYLTLDGINTYISATLDYLTPVTNGAVFGTLLTGQLWPVEGIALNIIQADESDAMDTTVSIWWKNMMEWGR